jgi:beta-glucanase (GH16 family)
MTTYSSLTNPANLTFDDEFNSFTSSPSGNTGNWSTARPYAGEAGRAQPGGGEANFDGDSTVGVNPFTDTNGVLSITANPETPTAANYEQPYSSGVITSAVSLNQQYGYFEVDAKLPAGQGLWSAFFLLDRNPYLPTYAEIDIYELLGNMQTTYNSFIHAYQNNAWTSDTTYLWGLANETTGFHSYGIDWEPNVSTLYIDGVAVATEATPEAANYPMYMILTLAVGNAGSWPGVPASNSIFPASYQINYVRVYATADTINVSGTEAIKTASISGQVQLGGAGAAGVTVSLLDDFGNVITTKTTTATGAYSFTALAAGNYQVEYTPPSGAYLEAGSAADAGTGLTSLVNLVDAQAVTMPTEVLLSAANSITLDGEVEYLGAAQAGVSVALLNTAGAVLATDTTDSNGDYSFTGLPAGTYQVQYTAPSGELLLDTAGVNPTTGLTAPITVSLTQPVVNLPIAQLGIAPASISGSVLYEGTGQGGITVELLNASNAVVATTTTEGDGSYTLANLVAGSYTVEFLAPSQEVPTTISAPATVVAGQSLVLAAETFTPALASLSGSVTLAGVGLAGVTVTLETSAGTTVSTTKTVSGGSFSFSGVAAGSYLLKYTAPSGDVLVTGSEANSSGVSPVITLSAGQAVSVPVEALLTKAGAATVTGKGLHFGGPTDPSYGAGEAGVTASLINASGAVIATTVSNSSGYIAFTDVAPGSYQIQYTAPNGQAFKSGTSSLTSNFTAVAGGTVGAAAGEVVSVTGIDGQVLLGSAGAAGVTVSLLSGGSIVQQATTGSNGDFTFTGMAAGTYQVQYAPPTTAVLQTIPSGSVATGLSEAVAWSTGQTVALPTAVLAVAPAAVSGIVTYNGIGQSGDTVLLLSVSGSTVATATTGSGGAFTLGGLAGGTYQVEFVAPSGETLANGSLANPDGSLTQLVTAIAGQTTSIGTEALIAAPAAIAGSVLLSGMAQAGVTVALLLAGKTILTTTTDSNGAYGFTGLAAGSYQVLFTAPSGEALVSDSLASPATGLTPVIQLAAGQSLTLAGELLGSATGSLSGSVVLGGVGQAGVTVELLGGAATETTTTASNGTYAFTSLVAGTYQVEFTAPANTLLGPNSLANASTGLSPQETVAAAQALTLAPETLVPAPSSLSGSVVLAGVGRSNVTVQLLSGGQTLATESTTSSGGFSFTGLAAGTYQVQYTAPSGDVLVGASDLTPTTLLSASETLTAGEAFTLPNATLAASATISGSVTYAGAGQDNVAVSLIDSATGSVVLTTTTAGTGGTFSFTGLEPDSYKVDFTAPTTETLGSSSLANASTGLTAPITVTAGQSLNIGTEALIPAYATLTGSVVLAGVGQAKVTVALLSAGATVTTTTNSSGGFSFTGLAPGSYQVQYTAPTGYVVAGASDLTPNVAVSATVTLSPGQSYALAAASLVAAATISGSVLYGGAGDDGVGVTLIDASGKIVQTTTTTGSGGTYAFTGLAAASYQVEFTPPATQLLGSGSAASATTGLTPTLSVAAGAAVSVAPETLVTALASLSGSVLLAGVGQSGVAVALLSPGQPTITTTSGGSGFFSFSNLAAGSYQVQYTAPSGYVMVGAADTAPTVALSSAVVLTAGSTVSVPTASLAPAASITGQVVYGGVGQAGVTVSLIDASGTVVQTTTTNGTGTYSFGGLAAATYQVKFTAPTGELLQSGGPANTLTGLTTPQTVVAGQSLSIGTETLVSTSSGLASLGGTVTLNGAGQTGVTVTLLNSLGKTVATTTTSGTGGAFAFTGLAAGSYAVKYTAPAGTVLELGSEAGTGTTSPYVSLAAGQAVTLQPEVLLTSSAAAVIAGKTLHFGGATDPSYGGGDVGTTVTLLSASGTVIQTVTSIVTGYYAFTDIGPGSYQILYTPQAYETIKPGTSALTPVFTVSPGKTTNPISGDFVSVATISGQVLFGGSGQAGVTVTLLGGSSNPTTTTAADGTFSFANLGAGTYQVQYTAPAGEVLQSTGLATGLSQPVTVTLGQANPLPAVVLAPAPATISGSVVYQGAAQSGVTVTLIDAGGNTDGSVQTASDGSFSFTGLAANTYTVDFTAPTGEVLAVGGPADPTSDQTAPITVVAGESVSLAPQALIPAFASVSGNVVLSGVGQAGVAVALLNAAGQVAATTTTDVNGLFSFASIIPGNYEIQYTAPSGDVVQGASDITPSIYVSTVLNLGAGESTNVSAVLLPAASMSGTVKYGTTLQGGNIATLVDSGGNIVASTTTASNGTYGFSGLAAGTYQVQFTPPTTEAATTLTATVTAGQALALPTETLVVAPASISGTVTLNGAAEAGAVVSLINVYGQTAATTTTDSSGAFSFTGLVASNYVVKYTAPTGAVLGVAGPAAVGNGQTPWQSVTAGQALVLPAEAMLTNPATITGKVLHFGATTDTIYGSGDPSVVVSLLNAGGSVIATTTPLSSGYYAFTGVGAGTYQVLFTAPSGQAIEPGTAGETAAFTLAAGQSYSANASLMSTLTLTGTGTSLTPAAGAYVVTGNASNSTLTLGAGNQFVTLTGTANTVVTGSGNQTINLSGSGNSITVGSGTSTISAGSGNDIVHAAGGNVTISATGGGNLFDSGAGMSFLNADGSANNIFMLNAAASGTLTTITGFNAAAGDILDLKRTLAGSAILPSLATIGSTITSSIAGSNTDLYYTTTTGGHTTSTEFAVLVGVNTTVAQLQTALAFSLT